MVARPEDFIDDFIDVPMDEGGLIMDRAWDPGVSPKNGRVRTNVPHHAVYNGEGGFDFGRDGHGPTDLALNALEELILCMYIDGNNDRPPDELIYGQVAIREKPFKGYVETTCVCKLAWDLHHKFSETFIAPAPRDGKQIPYSTLRDWTFEQVDRVRAKA